MLNADGQMEERQARPLHVPYTLHLSPALEIRRDKLPTPVFLVQVAQLVKNLPAMLETWVRSLGWEDPLEKGKATHSSILAWRIPWTV